MYAIYSLADKSLLRLVDTLEYDSTLEGYVPVADSYSGSTQWSPDYLDFKDLANDPTIHISSLEFIRRFTLEERLAIHNLAITDLVSKDLLYMLLISPTVDLVSPTVKGALDYLVYKLVLSPRRASQIRGYGSSTSNSTAST